METVVNDKGFHVLVDYAHKSDALEKVLKVLVELKKQQVRVGSLPFLAAGG